MPDRMSRLRAYEVFVFYVRDLSISVVIMSYQLTGRGLSVSILFEACSV